MNGTIFGQVVLSSTRKLAEPSMKNEAVHSRIDSVPVSRYCLSFCPEFPWWLTMRQKCKPNKLFLPPVGFGQCFITAT